MKNDVWLAIFSFLKLFAGRAELREAGFEQCAAYLDVNTCVVYCCRYLVCYIVVAFFS